MGEGCGGFGGKRGGFAARASGAPAARRSGGGALGLLLAVSSSRDFVGYNYCGGNYWGVCG